MSRVLAYTSPQRGHLFPLVPILEELRRRGHTVSLRTLSSEVPTMRTLGFDAEPVDPRIEALTVGDWRARSQLGGAKLAARHFCDRAVHDMPDLRQAIEGERPDLLLVDIVAWGALAAAEAWGGPWAAFCPMPLPFPSRATPPFGPGLRPARSPLTALLHASGRAFLDAASDRLICPRLNPLRASLALPALTHARELFLKPPLLLCLSVEGFDYPRPDWPPNVALVGPCVWDPPLELPVELRDVDAPLVLVTTSSEFQNDSSLVRLALAALAKEPYHLVATVPAADVAVPPQAANATLLPFVPHGPILARSVCAITHGGMGVTQKALAHGVPVCVVPYGRDQFEVARRVTVAGAGASLPPWRRRPEALRARVRRAISLRSGAEQIAELFDVKGGGRAAADALERKLTVP